MTPHHSVSAQSGIASIDALISTLTAAKGKFIRDNGLRGFALWEASTDYNNLLVDAISNAIGVEQVSC